MPLNFAAETRVSPEASRAEIERMLVKAGASRFGLIVEPLMTAIAFEAGGRRFRFEVHFPDRRHPYVQRTATGKPRPQHHQDVAVEQLYRIKWRTLVLSVKARLAEVEMGMADMHSAFLPFLLLPSGRTVAEETREPIALAYQGRSVPLLPGA